MVSGCKVKYKIGGRDSGLELPRSHFFKWWKVFWVKDTTKMLQRQPLPSLTVLLAIILSLIIWFPHTTPRVATGQTTPSPPEFVRITEGDLVTSGGMSRGVAWGDFNGDGFADLFAANSDNQTNALYRNNQDGTFTSIDNEITRIQSNSESGNWVDYDNDGDFDLFITNIENQANFLFRNDGDETFTRITDGQIVTETLSSTGSCWVDFDRDSDLDVLITNRDGQDNSFFLNNGDGTFSDTELFSGQAGDSRACGWAYANDDPYVDLFIGNAHEPNFFYLGNEDGTLTPITSEPLVSESEYTYGLSWADFDNDNDIDLFVANLQTSNSVFLNNANAEFEQIETDPIASNFRPSKGNTWGDFDNDGDLDLYIANGTPGATVLNSLYLNDGLGHFELITDGDLVSDDNISAGTAWSDYDHDGDLDLYVANWRDNDEDNTLYQNITASQNGWVKISLVGVDSNRHGIGAIVRLNTEIEGQNRWQTRQLFANTGYGSQNELPVHFGLGDATIIQTLEILWPSGHVHILHDVPINTWLTVVEGESPDS